MCRTPNKRLVSLLAVFLAGVLFGLTPARFGSAQTDASRDIKLTYLFSDGQMPVTLDALKALFEERPELRGRVDLEFITESTTATVTAADVVDSDVLVLDMMNQQMLDRFNTEHGIDLIGQIAARGKVLAVGVGIAPTDSYTAQGAAFDDRAQAYWQNSGVANHVGLIKYALTEAGIGGLELPDPEPSLDFGFYYPDGSGGRIFAGWPEFDAWRRAAGKTLPGAPKVAVGFYKANYYTRDMATVDAVIAEIESQGAEAIPLFGYPGSVAFERLLQDDEGGTRADVALAFLFRFADFESAKALERIGIPVINMVTLYGRSEAEWRESVTGLSMFEGTFQVAVPEIGGLVAPTVVGSKEQRLDLGTGVAVTVSDPVPSRIEMAVARALRYAALARKPASEKRIALMFYDYPPGKANIGASYLNVADSLANILARLDSEGYDTGGRDLSSAAVLSALQTEARNVAGYAPGELDELLQSSAPVRVPLAQYSEWLDALAPALREKIISDWGNPESFELMTADGAAGRELVLPIARFGNIVLMPQPSRGWGEDLDQLYHADDLAPHHQYVAAYEWLRREFGADAVVHIGTHGTLEWLDGKDVGQTEEDASDALLGDLPDLYVYNVDVVGEGLVARRRGLATLIDHMVPPFVEGGLYADLAALSESINDYDANFHKNPDLTNAYAEQIRERTMALGIAKDLSLDISAPGSLDHETIHEIQSHMATLRSQNIPYGLHAFGEVPETAARETTVDAIVNADRSLLPDAADVLAEQMDARIVRSGARELANLAGSLNGRFVPTGSGGEPIRNPDSYPTGKNFYGIDPDKVPKRAAWRLGVRLADEMLAAHLEEHGAYPEKVSFVIWGDETLRHEGVLESQIFYLLGTRPIWDERDKVVGVDVIPRSQLGRPRVDIVIASAAEGMFNNVTLLIDEAVQRVKILDEADNFVREHYLSTRAALIDLGYTESQADRRAGVRIFDEPPGTYNLNVSRITEASGSWDADSGIANDYLRKMGHGFGNGFWGEPMEDVFRLALAGTEKVVHSSSTMLYGALDNDDFYMYMGGLANAIGSLGDEEPELVVTNTRDPSNPEMTGIDEFIGIEFRSRYMNPTWIEGMQAEGYAGAGEMRSFVEYLWGWDATATATVDDGMWQETFAVYVEDKYGLNMQEFFDSESPFAYQDITARMIETIRKEYWQADRNTLDRLVREYVGSVNRHGVGCAEHSCGNPRLLEFVIDNAADAGVPAPDVAIFVEALEAAVGGSIPDLADLARDFVARNEAKINGRPIPSGAGVEEESIESAELQGYRLQQIERDQPMPATETASSQRDARSEVLLLGLLLIGALVYWRIKRRRQA